MSGACYDKAFWSKIVAFGDSTVQGGFCLENNCWLSLLANHFVRRCDVINRGFSGYTSRCLRRMAPMLFKPGQVSDISCFIIIVGANDSNLPTSPSGQHVPLIQYRSNLQEILEYLVYIGLKERIILLTPAKYYPKEFADLRRRRGLNPSHLDLNTLKQYVKTCLDVGRFVGVTTYNLFELTDNHPDGSELFYDGLHLSTLGSEVVFTNLKPLIEDKVRSYHGKLDPIFPIYSDLDLVTLSNLKP